LKFATEIFFNINFLLNKEQINLMDFKRLKKITIINMDFFFEQLLLPDSLPLGLKELYLNSQYSQPLDYLPESLEKLYFKCHMSYYHNFDNLPNNINELHINEVFIDKIKKFPTK
jgi:hypothetical protein